MSHAICIYMSLKTKYLLSMTQPKFLLPISGTYRHMIAYRDLCEKMNYKRNQIFLIENGQEVLFTAQQAKIGKKIEVKNVYVDEVSGEELESYVVRDRERLAQEGALILLVEINASNSQLASKPEVIMRGTSLSESSKEDLTLFETILRSSQQMSPWGTSESSLDGKCPGLRATMLTGIIYLISHQWPGP